MKSNKIIKIITIMLLVIITTIASICGIYKLKDYKVVNVIPNYLLGMEFTDSRLINLEVDKTIETKIYDKEGNEIIEQEEGIEYTEENGYKLVENKVNSEDILTLENYKQTKNILKNRLKKLGVDQYKISLDEGNGNLQIRIPENKNTDTVIYNLLQLGTFELKDSETEEILIDTNNVKDAKVVYGQAETQTTVYLQIKLDKEGKQKLEEISKKYIQTEEEITNEEGETEKTTNTKNVALCLSGEVITETYFGEPIVDGTLNISMGAGNNTKTLQQYMKTANESAVILNSGILPIKYTETNHTETANITEQQKNIAMYGTITILVIMLVIFVIKLKLKGILGAVLQIGYIAILLLVLRYTNVKITLEGTFGMLISSILNYIYIYKALKGTELNFIKDITKKYALKLIPIYVLSIILSFNSIANIYSLGMTLVWGIIVMYLYNLTLTKTLVNTIKE